MLGIEQTPKKRPQSTQWKFFQERDLQNIPQIGTSMPRNDQDSNAIQALELENLVKWKIFPLENKIKTLTQSTNENALSFNNATEQLKNQLEA